MEERTAQGTSAPIPSVVPFDLRANQQDIRRRNPLSFLLRFDTMRRLGRVVSMLVMDFLALYFAILTALMVKSIVKDGEWALEKSNVQTREEIAFAFLLVALLFARSDLYADRAQRPGLPKIISALFQATVVAMIFGLMASEMSQYTSY